MSGEKALLEKKPTEASIEEKEALLEEKQMSYKRSLTYGSTKTDISGGVCKSYDVGRLASFSVFKTWTGTVFENKGLWTETAGLFFVYATVFGLSYVLRWESFNEFVGKEENVRAFISMFSTLIGLLLSFYTALNLSRWWQMRDGVHDIENASAQLVMLLSQTVTKDREVLSAVQRYSRCSLWFIFASSQGHEDQWAHVVDRGLLTQDEADQLRSLSADKCFVQAETLWSWLAHIVNRLHAQGLTKGPPHFCQLISAVESGRHGVGKIESFLTTMVPMGYVHLLCFMVKLHNCLLAVLMALIGVMLLGDSHKISVQVVPLFRTCFRAFFMPFLYNAILILNTDVTDPFGTDSCDFDYASFDISMQETAEAFTSAATTVPLWMKKDRKYEPAGSSA